MNSPHAVIDALKRMAEELDDRPSRSGRVCNAWYEERVNTLLSAADCIVQLQERLVRQAMVFEHVEATLPRRLGERDPGCGL